MEGLRRDLVAVDPLIAVLPVVFEVGEHRVPGVGPQVHKHLLRGASHQVQVKVVVKQALLGLGRGDEVVAVPVVENGIQRFFER